MQINYNEQNRVFKIDTEHTSYCIGIVDEENFVGHIYYGRKLSDDNLVYLMRTMEPPFVPSKNNRTGIPFWIRSRWSIRAMGWEISGKAL